MSFETVNLITENLRSALEKTGIRFSCKTREESLSASLLPTGQIFYEAESFENTHGERPSYAEARYAVRVLVSNREQSGIVREEQRWAHAIRDALKADALNTGGLGAAKPVSRVSVAGVTIENRKDSSSLSCKVIVRYRES